MVQYAELSVKQYRNSLYAIRYMLYAIRYTLYAVRYTLYAIRYTLTLQEFVESIRQDAAVSKLVGRCSRAQSTR